MEKNTETIYRQQAKQFHKGVSRILSDFGGDSKEATFVNQAMKLLSDDQQETIAGKIYKVFATVLHPDKGGDREKMQTLNRLKDEMMHRQ